MELIFQRTALIGAITALAFTLTACGGGGTAADTPALPAGAACPHAQLSDAWINNRLACLAPGQRVLDMSASATGARADRAFVVAQLTLDANFNNLLPAGASRYFKHFVCVHNAPLGLTDASNRLNLATDLAVALGTSNFSNTKPPQVMAISLSVAGGNAPAWQDMPCNPALHPVIVDFDSRAVQSINPAALASLLVFDL